MRLFNVSRCPVCQSTEFSSFFRCSDHFVTGEIFSIKKCNTCGFKITEDVPEEEDMGRYYESESYISHSNTSKGFINRIYLLVRKIMLVRKRKLIQKVTGKKQGSILDVGSGTGFFLKEMKDHGWKVTGTEKNTKAREFAMADLQIPLLETEELFHLRGEKFDVITLWHVLEHVHDLDKNIHTFYENLQLHGKLILALPNHNSYDARKYREFWAAWDVPRHIWHFSAVHIVRLAGNYGFTLKATATMPFDAFYVSLLSEKYRKSSFGFIKGVIAGFISWVNSMFRRNQSSSLIFVFEKSGK